MGVNDTVVTTKDGERKELPSTWLTLEQVELLRDYANMASSMGLEATMVCGKCGEEAECYVQEDLGIFCSCRVLIWKRS